MFQKCSNSIANMKIALISLICFALAIQFHVMKADPDCTYVFVYQPVCGNDGQTYINSGHLTCEKLKNRNLRKIREGACPEDGSLLFVDGPRGDNDDESWENGIKIKGGLKKGIKKGTKKVVAGAVLAHIAKGIVKGNHKSHKSSKKGYRRGRSAEDYDSDSNESYEEIMNMFD